jgi:simple sugar transport system permease protein
MLNWVAFFHVPYLVRYHFSGIYLHKTAEALPTARYPVLGASLTAVIFVALAACVVVYFLLWRTRAGYELRLVGDNPDAARYAGISIRRAILVSFIVGGLAAGLAGASQVIGRPTPDWTLPMTLGTVFGLGFSGIGVALVGRNHPIGGIFAAILFAGMLNGAKFMEWDWGISSELIIAIQGVIIIALAIPELLAMSKGGIKKLTLKIRRKPK